MGRESSKSEVCSSLDLMASKFETVGMSSVMEILANGLTIPKKKKNKIITNRL